MRFYDILGRKIDEGDVVTIGCNYSGKIDLAKVVRFTKLCVQLRVYNSWDRVFNPTTGYWESIVNPITLNRLLKDEPNGWTRWTKTPEQRLIILKKAIKDAK